MGSELVGDSLDPQSEGGGETTASSFTSIFYKHLPYYLSIGMSADEFWLKDVSLAKAYREADELKKDRENEKFWLQGMYIYDTLTRLAPMFSFGGGKVEDYISEPYPRTKAQMKEAEERKNKLAQEQTIAMLKGWQKSVNDSRKGGDNG